jgi:hypothetical protein
MPIIALHELEPGQGGVQVYNSYDTLITYGVWENLKKLGGDLPVYNFERSLQAPVIDIMQRGFLVDPTARELAIMKIDKELGKISRIIDQIVSVVKGKSIPLTEKLDKFGNPPKHPKPLLLNPGSLPQLQKFFYDDLKLEKITKWTRDGIKLPMDEDTLKIIANYFPARPVVNAILTYRNLTKQLEVFERNIDRDWRMRTTYQIAGTTTTRFSSSKSIMGSGGNMQNINGNLRHVFIPDKGWKLYGIDLEQAESREVGLIIGLLFGDWSYLDYCESGDLHTSVCKLVWSEFPWTGDKKQDRKIADREFVNGKSYRDGSKTLGHGTVYLGKPKTMSLHSGIPANLVVDFQNKFFNAFPGIPLWHQYVKKELQTKNRLANVFGVTRYFFGRVDADATLREGVASMPQSATGQRLNLGLYRLWQGFPEVQILAQLHDAVYFQAPIEMDEVEVGRKALGLVEIVQHYGGRRFCIPGSIKSGFNWGERRERVNSDGSVTEVNPKGLSKIKGL